MYAVYQLGYVVYGIGETPANAKEDARSWLDDDKPEYVDLQQAVDGDLVVVECTDELANEVLESGGDVYVDFDGNVLTLRT